jgi:hypothetical protein
MHVGSNGTGVGRPNSELPEATEEVLVVRAESAPAAHERVTGILRDHGDYTCSVSSGDV